MAEQFLMDQVAWVSGASRGIGRAVAVALAEAGADVCIGARTREDLDQLAEVLGGKGHAIELDVSSKESVQEFSRRAVEAAGPPDILINNAGTGLFQDIDIMRTEDFDRQIDVTLKGPWYLTKEAAPLMKKQGGGLVINISSIAGRSPIKRGSAYCAAKAGLNMMMECLMLELRDWNIAVSTIAPGSVDTSFHQGASPQANPKDQSWMLTPDALSEAVLHLLSRPGNTLVNYYEVRPLQKK